MPKPSFSVLLLAQLLPIAGMAATLPGPWGALSTGTASASVGGIFENWVLANSFDNTAGLSEARMVTNEQQQITTTLVAVGAGTLSFGPGSGIVFTGMNFAPGHPFNHGTDFIEVGGGGFAVPVVFFQAQPDDNYSAAMTAFARTHGGSMTDPESSSGTPIASTSATAVFGPTPGGDPAVPFTTIFYSASVTVSENGGPAQSLFLGSFSLDSDGNLTTTGSISPANFTTTPGGFSFTAPIDFSAQLTDPTDSFTFNYSSEGDLFTQAIATPEPPSVFMLFPFLLALTVRQILTRAFTS